MSWPTWQTAPAPMAGVIPGQTLAAPVQSAVLPTAINAAPAVVPPGMQYNPEQWAQMQQQNWQQWAQWQQQYQQWHQQYGAEYQKSVTAMTAVAPPVAAMPVGAAPPPPPNENKPPLPPEDPPVGVQPLQTGYSVAPNYTTAHPKQAGGGYHTQPQFNRQPSGGGYNQLNQPTNNQEAPQQQWGNKRPLIGGNDYDNTNKRQMLDNQSTQWSGATKSSANQWQQQAPSSIQSGATSSTAAAAAAKGVNLEELTEAEKKFDKEFAAWEAQFNRWKEQNSSHPDKTQYKEYEKKWESWRNSLLERREQMRKKRLSLQAAKAPAAAPPAFNQPPLLTQPNEPLVTTNKPPLLGTGGIPSLMSNLIAPPPSQLSKDPVGIDIFTKPPPTQNNEPLSFQPNKGFPGENIPEHNEVPDDGGEGFLKSAAPSVGAAGGIPGLDLVDDKENDNSQEREAREQDGAPPLPLDSNSENVPPGGANKGPDLDAISKGINTILGDQKLLSMLSMVSQNQNVAAVPPSLINTTPKMVGNEYEQPPPRIVDNMQQAPPPFGAYHQSEQSNHSYEEQQQSQYQYNQREAVNNFDDQTRMSFPNTPNDDPGPMGPNFGNKHQNRFGNNMNNRNNDNNFGRFGGGPSGFQDDNFGNNANNNRGGFNNFGRNNSFNSDDFGNNQNEFGRFNDRGGPGNFGNNKFGGNNFGNQGGPRGGNFNPRNDNNLNSRNDNNFNSRNDNNFNPRNDNKFNPRNDNNFNSRNDKNFSSRSDSFENDKNYGRSNFNSNNRFGGNGNNFGNNDNYNDENYDDDYYNDDKYNNYDDQGYKDNNYQDDNNWNEEEDYDKYHELFNEDDEQNMPPQVPDIRNEMAMPRHDMGMPRHDMGMPRRDMGMPRHDMGMPRNDMSMNRNNMAMPRNDMPMPRNDMPMPRNDMPMPRNDMPMPRNDILMNRNDMAMPHNNMPLPQNDMAMPPNMVPEEEDKPLFVPESVVDYEHKSLKPVEPEVALEPSYTFDYRHKPVNRIPYPQRPRWLSETVKNIRQFDPLGGFVFDPSEAAAPERHFNRPSFEHPGFDNRRFPPQEDTWPPKKEERRFQDRNASIYRERDNSFDKDTLQFEPPPLVRERDEPRHFDRNQALCDRFSDDEEFERRDTDTRDSRDDRNRDFDRRRDRDFDRRDIRDDNRGRDDNNRGRDDNNRGKSNRDTRENENRRYGDNSRSKGDSFMSRRTDFDELSDGDWSDNDAKRGKRRDSPDLTIAANPSNPNPQGPVVSPVTMIEDLINPPGRYNRPPRIVIILRGPPGSGKTYLAKLIKDKEVESGGSAPRILSLDDYFMVEQEKEVMEDGKMVTVKDMVYEYEVEMEDSYRQSFMKSFKKTVTDGYFPFIIVDNVNDKVKHFGEMWSFAKQNGFQVYICQMDLDPQLCARRNIHNRSEHDIEECIAAWDPTPSHHPILDASAFIQSSEAITEVEMEDDLGTMQHDKGDDGDGQQSSMASASRLDHPEPWRNSSNWTTLGTNPPNPQNQAKRGFGGPTWRSRNNRRR